MSKTIFLAPRILSLLFVGFLTLFATDVFSEYQGFAVVLPFLIHLIPSFILFVVTLISWKYEVVGAIVFFLFAILYVISAGFDRPWSWYAFIAGPAVIVAILYLVSWKERHGK